MNIKQAAEMFDLTTDTLRYYERVSVIPPIYRNKSGYRDYTISDLNWIYLVKSLRRAGLSVESLIEFAALAQLKEQKNVENAQKQVNGLLKIQKDYGKEKRRNSSQTS